MASALKILKEAEELAEAAIAESLTAGSARLKKVKFPSNQSIGKSLERAFIGHAIRPAFTIPRNPKA